MLRKFGVNADQAVMDYLHNLPADQPLELEIQLKDMTAYGDNQPNKPLELTVRSVIRRN